MLRNSEEIFLQKSENGRERKCESDCFLLSVIESCCQKAKTKQILKITKCETNGTTNHLFETNPEAQNKTKLRFKLKQKTSGHGC